MGLRNVFDAIATEGTLSNILRAVTFARTASDQLRVVVDSGAVTIPTTTILSIYSAGSANSIGAANQIPFGPLSWNAQDGRIPTKDNSQQIFQQTRNRWTIS